MNQLPEPDYLHNQEQGQHLSVSRIQRRQSPDDPTNPRWKIPASQWPTVLQRIAQGESLRQVARDYGVSYEAVRRVLRAAQQ